LVGKPEVERPHKDLSINMKIILKYNLEKFCGRERTAFI
jgi:hypothetical protein